MKSSVLALIAISLLSGPALHAAKPKVTFENGMVRIKCKDRGSTAITRQVGGRLDIFEWEGTEHIYSFPYGQVEIIRFVGGPGKDKFRNETAIPVNATGGGNRDELFGGDGDDELNGDGGNDTLWGGDGNDKIRGGAGSDILSGQGGNDEIWGGGGGDTLNGNRGNDKLHGEDGNDILNGQRGNDTIRGNLGDDTIDGGEGNDDLRGGPGNRH